ncbi:MAG: zinc ribbon domain-containing protein [Thermoplasmata archaeon]
MATPVDLRCPHCGARLTAYTPYPQVTSYTRCPQCGSVLPFVAPREPAPLYSWEVYPGLYPPTSVPRPPSRWRQPALVALLIAATLLLVALGGVFAWDGSEALRPGTLIVGGTILPATAPGAWVDVQGENGFADNVSAATGTFVVSGVPYGGVTITTGAIGYETVQVDLFLSPVYSSVTGNPAAMQIDLTPANGTGVYIIDTTAFSDLETFVATVWSGTGLLWIAALFTGLGVLAVRRDGIPLVVVGGASAVVAPFILPLLGINVVSEALTVVGLTALPVGLVVLALALPPFVRAQPPVEPV